MKIRISVVSLLLICLCVNAAGDDSGNSIGESLRLVVIANDEGIHYAHGCAFYELRGLIADAATGVSKSAEAKGKPLYDVRLLAKGGQNTVHIGDHWIRTAAGVARIPSDKYQRIVELIENRKGQGIKKRRIEASVKRALAIVQSPDYVEDNRCARGDGELTEQ